MTAEVPPQEGQDWLESLSGRAQGGDIDTSASALRDALLPLPDAVPPDWQSLRQRAAGSDALAQTPAANDATWLPRLGWVAGVVLVAGLVFGITRQGDEAPVLRGGVAGGNDGAASAAIWLVDDPQAAAAALSAELRALGAVVDQAATAEGVTLNIRAGAEALAAVQQRLSPLEAGLDAQGRATLRVQRRR